MSKPEVCLKSPWFVNELKEKMMIKKLYIGVAMILLWMPEAFSQTADPPKFEVAAEFSSLTRSDGGSNSSAGFGGRFTFNFNKNVAVEGAAYVFPGKCFGCQHRGQVYQAPTSARVSPLLI